MADEYNTNWNNQNYEGQQNNSSQGPTNQTGNGYNTNSNSYGNQGSYQSAYSNYNAGGGNSNGGGTGGNGKKKGNGGKIVLAIIVAVLVGVAGGFGVSRAVGDGSSSGSSDEEVVAEEETNEEEESSEEEEEEESKLTTTTSSAVVTDVTEVVEQVMPCVVSVYNTSIATTEFFGQTYSEEETSTGTGFIVAEDEEGGELLIVTNNHVVEDAESLEVQFIDESTASALIKGTDEGNDLAVIAIELDEISEETLSEIAVATLGDSDTLKIGEPVVAIGNALGYGQSVTTGVVSALDREITVENVTGSFIQTDAAINPGNSGGPLVDLNGNVIGITSSKIGGSTVEGMGYAIPISTAIPIIDELMEQDTKVVVDEEDRGYLGISGVSVTSQVASAYNMPEGVYVAQLIEGGAAEESDLQKGDIITAINGSTVSDMEALQKQLTYYAVGDEITLTVERADGSGEYSEWDVIVKLGDYSAIEAYEEEQEEEETQQGRSYGYNNGGSEESEENEDDAEASNAE